MSEREKMMVKYVNGGFAKFVELWRINKINSKTKGFKLFMILFPYEQ